QICYGKVLAIIDSILETLRSIKLEIKIEFFFVLFWFQRKDLQRRRRERTRRQNQKQKKRREQRRMRRSCQRRRTQLLLRFLALISFETSCLVQFVLRFVMNQVLQLVDTGTSYYTTNTTELSLCGEFGTDLLSFRAAASANFLTKETPIPRGCREMISRAFALRLQRQEFASAFGGKDGQCVQRAEVNGKYSKKLDHQNHHTITVSERKVEVKMKSDHYLFDFLGVGAF
ncbi:BnaCnng68130D, partial [Brassica napus]